MKSIFRFIGIQILLVLVLVSFACAEGMNVNVGDKAPDFTLKELSTGKEVSLSDYRDKKIVLIQFWATWCAICKREIPFLVNHYNENLEKGDFEILAVLLPSGENEQKKVEALVKKYNIPYTILLDSDSKVATEKYELSGMIPVIAIVDKKGIVQFVHVGELSITEDPIPFVLDDLRGVVEE